MLQVGDYAVDKVAFVSLYEVEGVDGSGLVDVLNVSTGGRWRIRRSFLRLATSEEIGAVLRAEGIRAGAGLAWAWHGPGMSLMGMISPTRPTGSSSPPSERARK
jgi:hypothetical protein